jgi:hypothetical protein
MQAPGYQQMCLKPAELLHVAFKSVCFLHGDHLPVDLPQDLACDSRGIRHLGLLTKATAVFVKPAPGCDIVRL